MRKISIGRRQPWRRCGDDGANPPLMAEVLPKVRRRWPRIKMAERCGAFG
jgi:hypothetical protein